MAASGRWSTSSKVLRPIRDSGLVPGTDSRQPLSVHPRLPQRASGLFHYLVLTIRVAIPLVALAPSPVRAQIASVTQLTLRPVQLERVDFVVLLTAEWTDPHRSAEVALDLELTAPSGRALTLPGFHERGASGAPSVWRARFAPQESGTYRGRFVLANRGTRRTSDELEFAAAPSTRSGFLRPGGPWLLRFENGEPFRGIGENVGWESRARDDSRHFRALHEHPRFNYEYLLGRLANHGGNFVRTWMCAWNLPLEWPQVVDTDRYENAPGQRFNPTAAARLDQLVDLAESTGIYLMLVLDPHGSLLGGNWEINPYNARNGGPAATPADFFTAPAARARYRDRLRYLVARWGYSPHLGVWEFFNEVDNAMYEQKPARIPDAVVTAWHTEMSAYLRQLDPYGRPITTSISHRDVAGLNAVPAIDLNQKHIYRNTAAIPETIRRQVHADGKPYVIGEFGYEWDWSRNFDDFADRMDRDYKHGLWLGLFSPTPVLPMTWWWEYFDARNLTPYFAGVRAVSDRMLAAGRGDFAEVPVTAGALVALAVACGPETFVYVHNPADTAAHASLHLRWAAGPLPAIESYDPERRVWSPGPPATTAAGGIAIHDLALGPGESRVLVVR